MMPFSKLIVIGVSAGALEALSKILPLLPVNFPAPIVIVVHVPPDKKSIMAELLNDKCNIEVKEAEDKDPLQPGVAYVAPPDYHVLIENVGQISLSTEEHVLYSRPSINVLFETAADAFGDKVVGVVLTGANSDGARGLAAIAKAGGMAVIQEPVGAYASIMPAAALKTCPTARVLDLEKIAEYLQQAIIA